MDEQNSFPVVPPMTPAWPVPNGGFLPNMVPPQAFLEDELDEEEEEEALLRE